MQPRDFKPGDIVSIQPDGSYEYVFERMDQQAKAVAKYHVPPAFQTKVLVVTDQALICEGRNKQSGMAQWVQDACKAAGIPEDTTVMLGYYNEVEKPMPADLRQTIQGLTINLPPL